MLDPMRTLRIIVELRKNVWIENQKIYLYTADYDECRDGIRSVLDHVDGGQYTLHEDTTTKDLHKFYNFEAAITLRTGSWRLALDPNINRPIAFSPNHWKQIKLKEWKTEENCEMPENETLFVYED